MYNHVQCTLKTVNVVIQHSNYIFFMPALPFHAVPVSVRWQHQVARRPAMLAIGLRMLAIGLRKVHSCANMDSSAGRWVHSRAKWNSPQLLRRHHCSLVLINSQILPRVSTQSVVFAYFAIVILSVRLSVTLMFMSVTDRRIETAELFHRTVFIT